MVQSAKKLLIGLCFAVVLPCISNATIHTINLTNFTISPLNTAVILGDTVRWHVITGFHTTTSDSSSPKQWDSGTLTGGSNFDVIITASDSTGNYPYRCSIHNLTMIDTLRVSAPPVSCCVPPIRGNVNGTGGVTVTDLTFLVSFLFNSGPPPPCTDEANVNGVGGITVTDLTSLVNFLFNGGASPAACP